MRNEVCALITRTAAGSTVREPEKEVWCDKKSCVRSEYYAAYAVNLLPRFVLVVDSLDFESCAILDGEMRIYPSRVRYDGAVFEILRTYEPNINDIELTVG